MKGYVLTQTAEEELRAILKFVAEQDGYSRVIHLHDKFIETFETIAATPNAGFRRPRLTGDTVRWRILFRFLVIVSCMGRAT